MGLMDAYKKEPGGIEKLKERNPKWINDDYVKFIRFAEHMIEKNGEGILGFITNHGYLDNPTFRGMRWHLLKTFDKIYVLDLHGNAKKKEVSPDGSPDKNVFDIQQGVAIILAIKHKRDSTKLAQVFHGDLWGDRKGKYKALWKGEIGNLGTESAPISPQFLFPLRDYQLEDRYLEGFSIDKVFPVGVMGFQTHRDHFAIGQSANEIEARISDFLDQSKGDEDIRDRYQISDNRDWQLAKSRTLVTNTVDWKRYITKAEYRPFDQRFCYLHEAVMDYPRTELIQHSLCRDNLILGVGRQGLAVGPIEWCLVSVGKFAMDANLFRRGGVRCELLSNLVFEISGSCSGLIVLCGFNTVFEFNASDNFGQIIKAS